MSSFSHDGLEFAYRDRGEGLPLVFQHGLGADAGQAVELAPELSGVRVLALDCRAHGETRPLGPDEKIGLSASADDLLAFLDALGIERAVVGGVSMGAAIALSFAVRHPTRVQALVLSRPAWLDRPAPPNLRLHAVAGRLIRALGPEPGLEELVRSGDYRELAEACPASAESLAGQFREPRAAEAVVRLERIPLDGPAATRRDWAAIGVPTLVLAAQDDFVHPFAYGAELARSIPGASFRELTPKAVSAPAQVAETRAAIADFVVSRVTGLGR